ncbi:uncharacterized protein LOC118185190 [Stegodyphus dumicola]|uniref:uncharacterized protein LOC118185190 n=1 Tax=Stegodyphus dumicola TaxID=202533 RepID=UPI0015AEA4ED|nr:uncharacterized protein LOC118185190 [Stegodyphus dumicola]
MANYSSLFVDLYNTVLDKEKCQCNVSDNKIQNAIRNLKDAYMPNHSWESLTETSVIANYNDPAHRCAYLHKYAMCYTGMVSTLFEMAINVNADIREYIDSRKCLNVCSLGGGPGTDIIGILTVICRFGNFPAFMTVVDYASEWQITFKNIIKEIKSSFPEHVRMMVSSNYFKYQYLNGDLLSQVTTNSNIRNAVMSADIVTMVKFISAAACDKTRKMVKDIFGCMKPGALLIFIDNASGGFHEMISQVASECNMQLAFGPLLHYDYEDARFSRTRFGYTSQSKTKITFYVWKKPTDTTQLLKNEYYAYNQQSVDIPDFVSFKANYDPESQRISSNYKETQCGSCCLI